MGKPKMIKATNAEGLGEAFNCNKCGHLTKEGICLRVHRRQRLELTASGKCLNKWQKISKKDYD